jgi:hypothetical protein
MREHHRRNRCEYWWRGSKDDADHDCRESSLVNNDMHRRRFAGRSSASQMEFHASKKRNCGHVLRGFCPSIEALAGADNRRQIVQADYLSKAE